LALHFLMPYLTSREAFVRSAKLQLLFLCVIFGTFAIGVSKAQIVSLGGVTLPNLKQQLQAGLLARTPHELAFVDEVVDWPAVEKLIQLL